MMRLIEEEIHFLENLGRGDNRKEERRKEIKGLQTNK
jgi:hypothetical protein